MKLPRSFYLRDDVVSVSRDLLGKVLVRRSGKSTFSGIITETEAYAGEIDRASHAYRGRRTGRTEVMFGHGGIAYVYLCYGIHSLFNVVTAHEGIPHAVLVRAIWPVSGVKGMLVNSGKDSPMYSNFDGPGKLSRALGIRVSDTGTDLTGNRIWLEGDVFNLPGHWISTGKRIGVDYAGEDAHLPYRFYLNETGIHGLEDKFPLSV